MKIMIVDDEVIIRTGLASVIAWKELGLTLLPPAASAEEALARIPEEKPQILMTDIRMKGKSGLQLAEEARELAPALEVIILSGYGDFSYAQQALRQGVCDYLLKTSKPEDIIRTVMQAKRRLLERWAEESRAGQRLREEQKQRFHQWVIEGNAPFETIPDFLRARPLRNGGDGEYGEHGEVWQAMILTAEGWGGAESSLSLLLFAVQNMLEDLVPGAGFYAQRGRMVCVAPMSANRERRMKQLAGWTDWVERQLKCTLRLATGEPADLPERVYQGYATASIAFRYHTLIPERIWDYGDIVHRRGGKTVLTPEEETELGALLLDQDAVGLKAWTHRFVEELIRDPDCTLESLRACVQSAALAAHRWLARTLRAIGREDEFRPDPWTPGEETGPWTGIRDELFRHLHGVMQGYHGRVGEGQRSHVERAKAFIESCPAQEISLQQVANHVHLHPGHLSELFKKETGSTFSDFVTAVRIRKAEQLLAVTPAKVSEVAWMIGYEDVKYFSRLFKKYTGKTPSEYREWGDSQYAQAERRT